MPRPIPRAPYLLAGGVLLWPALCLALMLPLFLLAELLKPLLLVALPVLLLVMICRPLPGS